MNIELMKEVQKTDAQSKALARVIGILETEKIFIKEFSVSPNGFVLSLVSIEGLRS